MGTRGLVTVAALALAASACGRGNPLNGRDGGTPNERRDADGAVDDADGALDEGPAGRGSPPMDSPPVDPGPNPTRLDPGVTCGPDGCPGCPADQWCCDDNNVCCNIELGVCQDLSDPAQPYDPPSDRVPVGMPRPARPPTMAGAPAPPPLEPGQCEQSYVSRSRDGYCDAEWFCGEGFVHAYCEGGSDRWHCGCDRESTYGYSFIEYQIEGDLGDDACMDIGTLCLEAPSLDGTPATCSPTYRQQGRDHCGYDVECRRTVAVDDGNVSAELIETRNTYCERDGEHWVCSCNSAGGSARIEVAGYDADPDVCVEVSELCNSNTLQADGPVECQPRYQSAERGYCDAELECAREGTLGDRPVRVFEYRHANCQRRDNDVWGCQCYGGGMGNATDYFELEGSDGWALCTLAGERCAQ